MTGTFKLLVINLSKDCMLSTVFLANICFHYLILAQAFYMYDKIKNYAILQVYILLYCDFFFITK